MITMNKEEIKEYLRRVDELELKLTGEDKETLQWLLFGYNECARLLEEKEQALLDIKEYVEYYTNEYPECKVAEFDIMANPHCILDIINKVIKKDK